jgi:hypothetical protein
MPTVSKIMRAKLREILENVTILCHRASDAECVTRYTRSVAQAWRASRCTQRHAKCNALWIGCLETNAIMRWQWYTYSRFAVPTSRIDARGFVFARSEIQSWRESTYAPYSQLAWNATIHSLLFLRRNLIPTWNARSFRKRTNVRKRKTILACTISTRWESPR